MLGECGHLQLLRAAREQLDSRTCYEKTPASSYCHKTVPAANIIQNICDSYFSGSDQEG